MVMKNFQIEDGADLNKFIEKQFSKGCSKMCVVNSNTQISYINLECEICNKKAKVKIIKKR